MTDDAARLEEVKVMLGECDTTVRDIDIDTPRGPKREYLRIARANTLRAFRAVSKAIECEGDDNGGR